MNSDERLKPIAFEPGKTVTIKLPLKVAPWLRCTFQRTIGDQTRYFRGWMLSDGTFEPEEEIFPPEVIE